MTGATEKFFSFLNAQIDAHAKALTVDQMVILRSAQVQVQEADRQDYIAAKKQSKVFTADANGWTYLKVGADLAEFLADAVEYFLRRNGEENRSASLIQNFAGIARSRVKHRAQRRNH